MIRDIPSGEDYRLAADDLLNLAWSSATGLLLDRLETAELAELLARNNGFDYDAIVEGDDEYWRIATPTLSSALSLVQQAIEFTLKAAITDVSPFLLIVDEPRQWPARCQLEDVPFSSFRTLDAHDLPRVYDTVCPDRLPPTFRDWYEDLRTRRNRIMHGVTNKVEIRDINIIQSVLDASEFLAGERTWVNLRTGYLFDRTPRRYVEQAAFKTAVDFAGALYELEREIMTVIEIFPPSVAQRAFGFPKKQRRYLCLHCLSVRQKDEYFEFKDAEDDLCIRTSVLTEPSPTCDSVRCVICGGTYLVKRMECREEGCPSNVIDAHNGLCLVHDTYIEDGISIQKRVGLFAVEANAPPAQSN